MLDAPRRRRAFDKRLSSPAWRKVRAEVRRRDHHTCQACGRTGDLMIDHKVPADRYPGSHNDPANLWVLCRGCNVSKGDLTVEEWYAVTGRDRPMPRHPLTAPADYTRKEKP